MAMHPQQQNADKRWRAALWPSERAAEHTEPDLTSIEKLNL